jgi:hypothetical protein
MRGNSAADKIPHLIPYLVFFEEAPNEQIPLMPFDELRIPSPVKGSEGQSTKGPYSSFVLSKRLRYFP